MMSHCFLLEHQFIGARNEGKEEGMKRGGYVIRIIHLK